MPQRLRAGITVREVIGAVRGEEPQATQGNRTCGNCHNDYLLFGFL
jgi:hypothetical protein